MSTYPSYRAFATWVDFPPGLIHARVKDLVAAGHDRVRVQVLAHRAIRGRFVHRHKSQRTRQHPARTGLQLLRVDMYRDLHPVSNDAHTDVMPADTLIPIPAEFNTLIPTN